MALLEYSLKKLSLSCLVVVQSKKQVKNVLPLELSPRLRAGEDAERAALPLSLCN